MRTGLLALQLTICAWGADTAPDWLRAAAGQPFPRIDPAAPAIILLNEQLLAIDAVSRVTRTTRFAVKVLTRPGIALAVARAIYSTGTGKVRDLDAWTLSPAGAVKKHGKQETADTVLVNEDIYNEVRARIVTGVASAEPGSIFGFESITEEQVPFPQHEFHFQGELPVLLARLTLSLPVDWQAEALTFNHEPVNPVVFRGSYTWELRNLPFLTGESLRPPTSSLAPRLAVNYFPKGAAGTVKSWAAVSDWLAELQDPQAAPSAELAAKAAELTAGAVTTVDRARALAKYVQSVNYISIQTGIGRGGGYRPHAASDVLKKHYGDCKDKANLLRALLRAVGISSYMVAIYSGDPGYVHPEWPTPQQFNHAILAIDAAELNFPAVTSHAALGRILFFDPTNPHTNFGDLARDLQDNHALVIAPAGRGALVSTPSFPPESDRVERITTIRLSPEGDISAALRERSFGQVAAAERGRASLRTPQGALLAVERWIERTVRGAKITKSETTDSQSSLLLEVSFEAPKYGQVLGGRLLTFNGAVVARRDNFALADEPRTHALHIRPLLDSDEIRIDLPAGFQLDEAPDPVTLKAPFGDYSASWKMDGGTLALSRRLLLRRSSIPAADYKGVRDFFDRVRAAEQAAVVLVRKQ